MEKNLARHKGAMIYQPDDDFIQALDKAAGLDPEVIKLATKTMGPIINDVLAQTLLRGVPAMTRTGGLRQDLPAFGNVEQEFFEYAQGVRDRGPGEVGASHLPVLIGYGLTHMANAARFYQAMSDLVLTQGAGVDEKKAKIYVEGLAAYLNGERPELQKNKKKK